MTVFISWNYDNHEKFVAFIDVLQRKTFEARVRELLSRIESLFADKDPEFVGTVIANLVAQWIIADMRLLPESLRDKYRCDALRLFTSIVLDLLAEQETRQ